MKSFSLFVALFLLANVFDASAAVTIRFEDAKVEVGPNEEFTAMLVIDSDNLQAGAQPLANGLFSFAARIGFDPEQIEVGADGVFVAPQLNYSGFVPGASVLVDGTNIVIKGNISVAGNASAYAGTHLAEIAFRKRTRAGGKSILTIGSAQSNANESLIVDGQGTSLDKTVAFQNSEVVTSSGETPELSIAKRIDGSFAISFTPQSGNDHFLQVSSTLQQWSDFQALPVNTGQAIVPSTTAPRFFRLRISPR